MNIVTMPCARVETLSVDVDRIPDDIRDKLVAWALTARASNTFASMSESEGYGPADWRKAVNELIESAYDGSIKFGTGGGGAKVSPIEREERSAFATWLAGTKAGKGLKKADVDKMATKWRDSVSAIYEATGAEGWHDAANMRVAKIAYAAKTALAAKQDDGSDEVEV